MKKSDSLILHGRFCEDFGIKGLSLMLLEVLAAEGGKKYMPLPSQEIRCWLGECDTERLLAGLAEKSLIEFKRDVSGNIMYKILKYEKKKAVKSPIFMKHLLELGVPEELAEEFLKVRSAKRGVDTETAWQRMNKQIDEARSRFGVTAEDVIRVCVERSWVGFEADWLKNINFKKKSTENAAETLHDGTTMLLGKRYYRSAKDGSMKTCPEGAPSRPSPYFDYSYSRMRWEAI